MATPPDAKTIELLNSATKGRRLRRRWPIVVALLATLALLICGGIFGVEGWRQHKIGAAEKHFKTIANEAAAEFSHVTDFRQWYIDRAGEGWGGDDFEAWIDQLQKVGERPEPDWSMFDSVTASLTGKRFTEPLPSEAELRAYLQRTEAFAAKADELLKHTTLSIAPNFSDGSPTFRVIDTLQAAKVPYYRAEALALLGDHDAAWRECERLYAIADRLNHAATLVEYVVFSGVQGLANELFTTLCARHLPPETFAVRTPATLPQDRLEVLVENELAYMVQMFNLPHEVANWPAHEFSGWFGWVRWDEDLEEWPESFSAPWQEWETYASIFEGTLRLHQALRAGKPRPPESRESMMHVWSRPAEARARLAYARFRAALAWDIRQAEARGTAIVDFVADADRYSGVFIEQQSDGWYEVRWDISQTIKKALRDVYADDAELFEPPERIRLLPLR